MPRIHNHNKIALTVDELLYTTFQVHSSAILKALLSLSFIWKPQIVLKKRGTYRPCLCLLAVVTP